MRFYYKERNDEFFRACSALRSERPYLTARQIASEASMRPAESFYLTERQVMEIIMRMRCGNDNPSCAVCGEMHREIFSRYWRIKTEHPEMSVRAIAFEISLQEAPRFYICERGAYKLYLKHLKGLL